MTTKAGTAAAVAPDVGWLAIPEVHPVGFALILFMSASKA